MGCSYVNSNYRFVVNPRGDYRAQAVDSDVHLPWECILQVLASAVTQCPNCPICLSTPVAPRMAKCGHIFCLPCLARYMASSDGDNPSEKKPRYKKCVICADSVYLSDVRPVRFFRGQQSEPPREGQDIVLRLVMRRPGSTLALPRDGADPPSGLEELPWHFAAEVMDYGRVMKGSEDYMAEQFNREIRELEEMQQEDELMFGEEGTWSRKAIGMIRSQMEALAGMGSPPPVAESPQKGKPEEEDRPPIVFREDTDDVPEMYHILHEASSGHASQSHTPVPQAEGLPGAQQQQQHLSGTALSSSLAMPQPSRPRSLAAAHAPHDSPYYFYQSLLHHYLSPLDIRILKVAFGSFAAFPSTILPRVENVSTGHTVDNNLRKRAKYLAHLPYGCEVCFLECDWTDIVPPETLEKFKTEIERRRKVKRDKETKEERDRIRAEKLEDEEKWAAVRQRRRESLARGEECDAGGVSDALPDPTFFAPAITPSSGDRQLGGSRESVFANLDSSPLSDGGILHRTVWGTPVVATREAPARRMAEDTGGWLPDWERELLLEEEMLAQIEIEESLGDGPAPSHGRGQKKKKFKKVTLMTNGGRRGA